MKKTLLLSFTIAFMGLNAQIVTIPDANFKAALIAAGVDANTDGNIQVSEAQATTDLDINTKSITDLTGISAFTALQTLYCYSNSLTSLNVSANTALVLLDCGSNQITSLNVNANTALISIDCSDNQLSSLNVSSIASLTSLRCNHNALTTLNISSNPNLTSLICNNNQLTDLNTDSAIALDYIQCNNNLLDSLDVTNNPLLATLFCAFNQLKALDVSKNTALTFLDCSNNLDLELVCVNATQLSLTSSNAASWVKTNDNTDWSTTNCADSIVGLEEITENNTPKTLLRVFNLLGQEVNHNEIQTGVIFIYQYSDGSVEKKVRL